MTNFVVRLLSQKTPHTQNCKSDNMNLEFHLHLSSSWLALVFALIGTVNSVGIIYRFINGDRGNRSETIIELGVD